MNSLFPIRFSEPLPLVEPEIPKVPPEITPAPQKEDPSPMIPERKPQIDVPPAQEPDEAEEQEENIEN